MVVGWAGSRSEAKRSCPRGELRGVNARQCEARRHAPRGQNLTLRVRTGPPYRLLLSRRPVVMVWWRDAIGDPTMCGRHRTLCWAMVLTAAWLAVPRRARAAEWHVSPNGKADEPLSSGDLVFVVER